VGVSLRLPAERAEVVETARRMHADGLVSGTSGNVSRRRGDLVAITPMGRDYMTMAVEDVCVVGLDGRSVEGELAPSTETPVHLAIYRAFAAGAVVHTHSLYATVVSTVAAELPAIHYLIATLGGPVRVSPYRLFGTEELSESVLAAGAGRWAVIMGSHGAITWGTDLAEAYRRAVTLEWLAKLYCLAVEAGSPRLLTAEELEEVARQFERTGYFGPPGVIGRGTPPV
jgi:L-fuculose-phosphate aldolase